MSVYTFLPGENGLLGVLVDGEPSGLARDYLRRNPDAIDSLADALLVHIRSTQAGEVAVLQAQLATANATIAALRLQYEPPPAPDNLLVVELPEPIGAADHAGITGIVKGRWHADLLKETGENTYVLIQENGLVFPAGESVTSLSELTQAQIEADLAAYTAAP